MTHTTDDRPIGQRSGRKPPHVGPFDLVALGGVLRSGVEHAEQRADREEVAVSVYLVRDAMMGGGQGVAVRTESEGPPPGEHELYRTIAAPAEFTGRAQEFFLAYFAELADEVAKKPDAYAWAPEAAPLVARRMVRALVKGTANKDSNPMRRACRKLGIAHTYKAINEFLHGGAA